MMILPTYEESEEAFVKFTATALQKFVHRQTPQFYPDSFGVDLQAAADEIERAAYIEQLEAVSAAPDKQRAIAAIRRLIEAEIVPLGLPDEIDRQMGDAG